MRTVWKYEVQMDAGHTVHNMPTETRIVNVGWDPAWPEGLSIGLWALVKTNNPMVEREFYILGTGFEWNEGDTYIGTVQANAFVWHVFEVTR